MPAAGLLVIKRRMNSVKSTQKITKAMALVSTSKARKAKAKLEHNNIYYKSLDIIKHDMFTLYQDFQDSVFVKPNNSNKKLYVMFASNSGFCGGFNANAASYLSDKYTTKEEKKNIDNYVIGSRGVSYSKKYKFNIIDVEDSIKDEIDIKTARRLALEFMNMYASGEYNEVVFLYTKFKSLVEQELVELPVLPIKDSQSEMKDSDNIFEFEGNPEFLVENFVYRFIEGTIINCICNSVASEENARMQAMDGATRNAGDIIENLGIKYNRIRQAAITQEISEIVGGAEAQK